jgi:hypothetical protein
MVIVDNFIARGVFDFVSNSLSPRRVGNPARNFSFQKGLL